MIDNDVRAAIREEINGVFAPLVDAVNRNTLEIRRAIAELKEQDQEAISARCREREVQETFLELVDSFYKRLGKIENAITGKKIAAAKAANRRKS